ncbi:MAG TPA: glycine cleavage system aminomethyltransferase GcvT, partial [Geobacterales bacterium]|nr:glycine cleavage system aminomethyltransferase GcvT [Geobacterales bacterium]
MNDLRKTPLHAEHLRLRALMAPFGGWDMPIQYEGIIAEHRWCREKAALFDICHMGELSFSGDLVAAGLDQAFSVPPSTIPVGRSRYGFLLNDQGGIIDDLILFRRGADELLIVVNAATADNDYTIIAQRLHGGDLRNISSTTAKLDLQGPLARQVMERFFPQHVAQLPYFRFSPLSLLGTELLVSRTGYTGELGYEIFLSSERVEELWRLLLTDERVKPAGLGARDLLRLEMGYSLYGSDIDEKTTPLQADLASFVDFKRPFVGREALLAEEQGGVKRKKIAFQLDSRRSPRHDYEIDFAGQRVGTVTSGAFS